MTTDPAPAIARTRAPFDALTIALHWSTLLLVLSQLTTIWLHAGVHDDRRSTLLLDWHRSLGVAIWALTALRLLWRRTGARLPPFPASFTSWHRLTVRLSEYALYALLLSQPLTGLAQSLLRGRAFDLFGLPVPPLFGKHLALYQQLHELHELGAWCLILLIGVHAMAALVHHFVLRDDVLETMAPALRRRS